MSKTISIIVAIAEKWAIGQKNDLLCHIPGDLKRFKEITSGHTVVMGRRTLISLPNGPLPKRTNIVISDVSTEAFEGCVMANSIEDAIDKCPENEESFIIGGGMIYNQFLPHADKLYLTRVKKEFAEADTFFPEINFDEYILEDEIIFKPGEKAEFGFSYETYRRKS